MVVLVVGRDKHHPGRRGGRLEQQVGHFEAAEPRHLDVEGPRALEFRPWMDLLLDYYSKRC